VFKWLTFKTYATKTNFISPTKHKQTNKQRKKYKLTLKLEFFSNFEAIIEIPSPKLEQIRKGEGVPIWNGWVGMESQRLEIEKITWIGGCDNLKRRLSTNNDQQEDE
jgi:hypothetical protein